jgi:hypothetical protein
MGDAADKCKTRDALKAAPDGLGSLNEREKRRYAAVEAAKLGHGGLNYISELLNCDPKTVQAGLLEIEAAQDLESEGQREKGLSTVLLKVQPDWVSVVSACHSSIAGCGFGSGLCLMQCCRNSIMWRFLVRVEIGKPFPPRSEAFFRPCNQLNCRPPSTIKV